MKLKPYMLVYVKRDHGHYVGEALSFPTPEHTIMVRRIPGHPGTLEEVPLEKIDTITKVPAGRRWIHYATCHGRGAFPWDMLRYDVAAPLNVKETDEYPYYEIDPS